MDLSAAENELFTSLPPVLRAVVKALGLSRAKEFLTENGGSNMTIPKFCSGSHGLSEEELQSMNKCLDNHMDALGRLWMPKADKLFIHERNLQIRQEREHMSINDLVRRYRLSSRQIVNICRDA